MRHLVNQFKVGPYYIVVGSSYLLRIQSTLDNLQQTVDTTILIESEGLEFSSYYRKLIKYLNPSNLKKRLMFSDLPSFISGN